MIPEAYWKLLWHWWWLIAIFFVLGAVGSFYVVNSNVTYESKGVFEVAYVQSPEGVISFNDFARRVEANRLAAEMNGTWINQFLIPALLQRGVPFDQTHVPNFAVTAPSRNEARVGPAIVSISAQDKDPEVARMLAEVATEEFVEYLIGRQDRMLNLRREQARTQVELLEGELRGILILKRLALQDEATRVNSATEDLIQAHQTLLMTLPTALDEFVTDVESAGQVLLLNQGQLDEIAGSLMIRVSAFDREWQNTLGPALRTLYAADSVPGYQLALIAEGPVRAEYLAALKLRTSLLTDLETNGEASASINLIASSSTPELVRALGLRTRFVLIGGGAMGLIIGWIFANLGEHILGVRRRRKELDETPDTQAPGTA